jgi:hypothetical protein
MKNNKIPHCQDSSCGILLFFMDVGTVLTVWYFVVFLLELSGQCGILLFSNGTVLIVWYIVLFNEFWNCPENVLF